MAIGMLVSIALIDKNAIDHDLARGGLEEEGPDKGHAEGLMALLSDRRLLVFAGCVVIFHSANAALLPLVSQQLALGSDTGMGFAFTSACIIAAQFFMIPMALLCGARADTWGRKPLFLAAFTLLPIRGLLFTLSNDSYYLVGVQALDGLANGIFGMIFLLILADLTRGTGRFNAAQGALTTLIGLGATFSNIVAGWVVELAGYSAGFLFLAAIGVVGALLFGLAMPETAPELQKRRDVETTSDMSVRERI
jgi:MFS family permease